ncbi:CbiQ family ECF transporter T component [Rhizobium sp. SL42]|uniref:CbiQ family ECF transporter T component n=1 Tax=Rhizobium sp. SL42 TaxID=2806346 RepID=UPI001F3BAD21|nr:CbiQ family ECF transporter T component [Rhizobium sp. SL42]UJW77230.1 hypothetical protein IM739_19345 [Rhizobium sp. SL42]
MRAIDRCAQTNRWRHYATGEKLLLAVGLMIISLDSVGWTGQIGLLIAILALMKTGPGLRLHDIFKAARVPMLFIITGTLAQLVSVRMVGFVPTLSLVSTDAAYSAGFVALRSTTCIAALLLLALTTPLSSIVQLLQRMGLNAELSDIAMAMFRLIWLLLDCLEAGQQSLGSRLGYTSNRRMLTSNGLLLASLLPRVLGRAQRIEAGLAARGYGGRLNFISVEQPASNVRLLMITCLLGSVAVLMWCAP